MNRPTISNLVSTELASFVAALREVFHGERWEDVEKYAERAWRACELEDQGTWAEVVSTVRDCWER